MTRNAPLFPVPGRLQRIFRKPPLPLIKLPASGGASMQFAASDNYRPGAGGEFPL